MSGGVTSNMHDGVLRARYQGALEGFPQEDWAAPEFDTVAYIPNSVVLEARAKITAAFEAGDVEAGAAIHAAFEAGDVEAGDVEAGAAIHAAFEAGDVEAGTVCSMIHMSFYRPRVRSGGP